jgi:hypothetical protein
MPAGDQTGPRGLGPMTGRAVGFCAGFDVPGYTRGGGFGRGGHGWGRGWRHRAGARDMARTPRTTADLPAPISAPSTQAAGPAAEVDEIKLLRAQASVAAATLAEVLRRLDALTADKQPDAGQQ